VDVTGLGYGVSFSFDGAGLTDTAGLSGSMNLGLPASGTINNVNVITGNGAPNTSVSYTGSSTATWAVDGWQSGSLGVGGGSMAFSGINVLNGGTGNDNLTITGLLNADGMTFNGGSGTNTVFVDETTETTGHTYTANTVSPGIPD